MIAAANQAGPAVVLSFVISGLACTFAALSYAELASSIGGCGSAYAYEYVTFGELIAWLIGWTSLSLFLYFIYGYKNSNLNR